MAKFTDFELSEPLLRAISDMGFEEATPIQEQAIPLVMSGQDLIGQAQTGTGKTAAFGIPMLEDIDTDSPVIQALVVAPTRELVVQVAEELNRLGKHMGVVTVAIYGGQDIGRQIRALHKRPQIITATPGRLMDHMRRRTIRLDQVEMVVLDEADEMLNMGFLEDIETILSALPSERQTLLFSATMPEAIRQLAERFMRQPEQVSIRAKEMTVPSIEQYYIELSEQQKFDALCRLLDMQVPELAMVFGRTKRRVDELMMALSTRGYSSEGIHGDMTQARRDTVMRKFRTGSIDVLVATDVAARGLDITGVTHVFNFDMPQDPEWYVHRIGRTGRAGKTGVAITFVTHREMGYLRQLERQIRRRIERMPMPTLTDAVEGQLRSAAENLQRVIAEGGLERYLPWAEELLAETESVTLLAAALKVMTREPDVTPVELTSEEPARTRRSYPDRRGSSGGQFSRRDGRSRSYGERSSRPAGHSSRRSGYERRQSGGGRRPQDGPQGSRQWQ
ncbi:MAG: DEAD/DEAH box helicase [Bacillota bacterium]|jgi:ATP-dependent RNA helicase DeaD